MGQSSRKIPVIGICGTSEKRHKRRANRLLRRKTKQTGIGAEILPLMREDSDVWDFATGGKDYLPGATLRK
jgi:hypothetical protein